MILSVIIVSYNVKYFLEQCLCSVEKAIHYWNSNKNQGIEVIVVDNNSSDNTVSYLNSGFSSVNLISNKTNVGFSKANNIAIRKATGEYFLFLNPDTIIPENFFTECLSFLTTHKDAGGVGVKMIDGRGQYLKESKRGFPKPWVSFYKLTGITSLFPTSGKFARYYLGHLDKNKVQQVDALSGACMFVSRIAIEKAGTFDERFFMYAEDIDLSYRIVRSGLKNYYLPSPVIIHFKGESTKKDFKYVKMFYGAMVEFVEKHYRHNRVLPAILKIGIWLRGALATAFVSSSKKDDQISSISLKGDPSCCSKLKSLLINQIQINDSQESRTLLCEGDSFSFANIIRTINDHPGQYLLHSSGSRSVVGANHSQEILPQHQLN